MKAGFRGLVRLGAVLFGLALQGDFVCEAADLTVVNTATLSDGTVIACCLDSAEAWTVAVMVEGQPSGSALQRKRKRLARQISEIKNRLAASAGSQKSKLRKSLKSKRALKAEIDSFRASCPAPQPVPTPDPGAIQDGVIAGHAAVAAFSNIPAAVFDTVARSFRVFYGHTSHGSQILTGIQILSNTGAAPAFEEIHEYGGDLGHSGDLAWVDVTRDWLNTHPTYNVVMWSWCGGVSDNTVGGIDAYLNAMSQLEIDFPNVIFVYMTGHLDGSGENGRLRTRNRQIRDYCLANGKVLFDFEDIESWDPDGNYYADDTDACEWCSSWCGAHACPSCSAVGDCAHSHCFNCYQKGKAWWWMMARLSGWQG